MLNPHLRALGDVVPVIILVIGSLLFLASFIVVNRGIADLKKNMVPVMILAVVGLVTAYIGGSWLLVKDIDDKEAAVHRQYSSTSRGPAEVVPAPK